MNSELKIVDMPFCMGPMDVPSNPEGISELYPFRAKVNQKLARFEQVGDKHLNKMLSLAYSAGVGMGTPSDSTNLGLPYVEDFLEFVSKNIQPSAKQILEIGAGTGYLSGRLKAKGWDVTSIEPGKGYEDHWKKNNVSVVNDFFPSKKINCKYDAIIFYTVLEHISNTHDFLQNVINQLNPNGKIFIAVPDCTEELQLGDPSMLLHEHYQYFTRPSLSNTLLDAGLSSIIIPSKYGRSLFAVAKKRELDDLIFDLSELQTLEKYIHKYQSYRKRIQSFLLNVGKKNTVGIYCPSRLLNILEHGKDYRFYDDATNLVGKFYPPFDTPIMSRLELLSNPPDVVLIASRTFGLRIKKQLFEQNIKSKIYTIDMLE